MLNYTESTDNGKVRAMAANEVFDVQENEDETILHPRVWDVSRFVDGYPVIGKHLVTFDRKTFST